MATAKRAYMPIYNEHIKVIKDMVTAEQLGRIILALYEYADSGVRPEVEEDIKFPFAFMASKLEEAEAAYAAKVEAGREAARRQHEKKDEEQEEQAEEEVPKGTQRYPDVPKESQTIKNNINKNNNNKNLKEKNKTKKEKPGGGMPRARNGTNDNFNYAMRSDDLTEVLMEL